MHPANPGSAPDGIPPLRVLCVDDNRDVADSEADLLHVHECDARACYSGASALVEVAEFRPCVCLIDLNMPGMDGDELAVRLREQEGGPPPILWPSPREMTKRASIVSERQGLTRTSSSRSIRTSWWRLSRACDRYVIRHNANGRALCG
jgi:CheY-like chemotaxis protein